jgi:hypothetical protein
LVRSTGTENLRTSALRVLQSASLLAKLIPKPTESAFVNDFVKPGLVGKQPVRLALQLNPRSLDLAFRTLEKDKGADPINLPLEGAIRLIGRVHACQQSIQPSVVQVPLISSNRVNVVV